MIPAASEAQTLEQRYRDTVSRWGYRDDPAQRAVLQRLDGLRADLAAAGPVRTGPLSWLLRRRPVNGLYLWGGVGRGKTFLADLFFESLPFEDRRRLHFHRLMRGVHDELKRRPGADPLPGIARDLARQARVLCIDEFAVSDIADAMILGRWLGALFDAGVTVVATSNIPPDGLYRGGLQRERFAPAIERIKSHMAVVELAGGDDYRLRALERAELYHCPLDEGADASLARAFDSLAPEPGEHGALLEINGRRLPTRCHADGVACFGFDVLCEGPRSADDYVELAREHHSLLLSGVPVMDDHANNAARRFIALVDECYERNVKLIVSAESPPGSLYTGKRLAFEFRRTHSRLVEMQSHDYLERRHRP